MNCPACETENAEGARYCAKCGALMPVAHVTGADPMIGSVVGGRYRITGLLGEGGMGRVYTAEQQMGTAVRKVAVKTLLEEFSKDPQVVQRFMRECGTVVELEHPNTIKFYDFGQTDAADLYIAMEFVDGKPLNDVIEAAGGMEPRRVIKIMKQMCGSLNEAHEKGVVHRDLKPENVILTTRAGETDFVKVLDFGIAKRSEASEDEREQKLTQAGMVLGTPPYMSPEQFTGKKLDQRSDIYSLGVLSYEMLTGQLPFKAQTPWEWATQHMTAQPFPFEQTGEMGANVPDYCKNAVMKALTKDRDHRYTTAREFFQELCGEGQAGTLSQPRKQDAALGGAKTEAFGADGGAAPPGMVPSAPSPAGASKAGATQMGEPLFPPGGAGPMGAGPMGAGPMGAGPMGAGPMGAGPMGSGPMAVAPAGAAPAGATQMGGGPPQGGVPAGAGQAIPAPPPMTDRGGGGGGKGPLIAVAGVLALGLVAGVVYAVVSSGGGGDTEVETFDVSATKSEDDASSSDKSSTSGDESSAASGSDSASAGGGATGAGGTGTVAAPSTGSGDDPTTGSGQPSTGSGQPSSGSGQPSSGSGQPSSGSGQPSSGSGGESGTAACNAASAAAQAKNCSSARSHFARCNGFKRSTAAANIQRYCKRKIRP